MAKSQEYRLEYWNDGELQTHKEYEAISLMVAKHVASVIGLDNPSDFGEWKNRLHPIGQFHCWMRENGGETLYMYPIPNYRRNKRAA